MVHAGSGRELDEIISYCEVTNSSLVELATGSRLESASLPFTVLVCPNTNILMLKFMSMLDESGELFRDYRIQITESHQAQKHSVPGTAVSIARVLGVPERDIRSVRDQQVQLTELGISESHLARHAFHQIRIEDGECSLTLEACVYGNSPYAEGVSRIVAAVGRRELENRQYSIMEFIKNKWL